MGLGDMESLQSALWAKIICDESVKQCLSLISLWQIPIRDLGCPLLCTVLHELVWVWGRDEV